MASLLTFITNAEDDVASVLSFIASLAPANASAPATVKVSTLPTTIAASSLSQSLSTLESVYGSLAAKTAGLPSGTVLAIADLAGEIDPELVPLIAAAEGIEPFVAGAFALLSSGTAAPTGIARGQRGGVGES